ncbi:preprotein translocase subunit SecG [Woeseia oceani]|uniref:Protein-export membrane protein SecG n=1 Tax=Woeseia oceani TaxID=1548547 RepID=A0A193LL18_9GAMM|nr:preprotein translocase subunit SecG [Woeseia oceani]
MQTAVLIGHTLIAILIIVLVLIQRGKGADAGAAFGGGASGTVFGARGSSSFFSRMTAVLATAFFATSLTLAYMSSQRAEAPTSLIESAPIVDEAAAPGADEVPELPTLDPADEAAEDMPSLESSDDAVDPE